MTEPETRHGATNLTAALWQQRRLLHNLILIVESRTKAAALGQTADPKLEADLMAALNELRLSELARDIESSGTAATWDLPPDASLLKLSRAAPPGPWGEILRDHREAMLKQTATIKALTTDLPTTWALPRTLTNYLT